MRGARRESEGESEGEKEKHLRELEEREGFERVGRVKVKEQDLFGTFLLLPLLLDC